MRSTFRRGFRIHYGKTLKVSAQNAPYSTPAL